MRRDPHDDLPPAFGGRFSAMELVVYFLIIAAMVATIAYVTS